MAPKKHIIIGCGPAALSALEKIRAVTSEDEVRLFTMDENPPYCPASLPSLLSGRMTEAELWMKDRDYFESLKSTLVKGKEVTQVLAEERKVICRDGSSENYDTLLIASGSVPVTPSIKGLEEVEIHSLRNLADCHYLMQQLEGKKDVAILGAGMVGMEIATMLMKRQYQVSIIEKEQSILPLYFNEEAEAYIRDIFTEHQAHFFIGKEVTAVSKENSKTSITLSDGSSLDADVVINAMGVKSRVSFLEGSDIAVNTGILVDRKMRTNVDGIYAAGDVAEAQDFFTGKSKVNAIIQSAVMQGKVAGVNMTGGDAEYPGSIPMLAFNFFANQAFSIGLTSPLAGTGQIFKEKDDEKRRFRRLIFDGDRLVGVMLINEEIDPGTILYLIQRRTNMAPYKEALFERTRPLTNPWLSPLKFSTISRRLKLN